eukprot:Sspe_Gene.53744::Locus_29681_Transcript_1_1_Confidence_1.000_Length_3355::g.53744::m.53744
MEDHSEWVRIVFKETRAAGEKGPRIGLLDVRGNCGQQLNITHLSASRGSPYPVADGSHTTSWHGRNQGYITFQLTSRLYSYRFFTPPGEGPSADPTAWEVQEGCGRAGPWTTVHCVTNAKLPEERQEWSEEYVVRHGEPPMPISPYKVLNVGLETTWCDIAARYKHQALLAHPFVAPDRDDEFWALSAAAVLLATRREGLTVEATLPPPPLLDAHLVFNQIYGLSWKIREKDRVPPLFDASNGSPEEKPEQEDPVQYYHVKSRMVNSLRDTSMSDFEAGMNQWGLSELVAWKTPRPAGSVGRVVVLRHGMGFHNDLHGAASHANRDAYLNPVGVLQAKRVGKLLRAAGVLEAVGLLVVSPFKRALETALFVFERDARYTPTLIQPLAAEHTLARSAVQQGDRGSLSSELRACFPSSDYPQLDFSTVDTYATEMGCQNGRWWHHGPPPRTFETYASFSRRAVRFRKWLSQVCTNHNVKTLCVVSHGGLLLKAFGTPHMANCEFRVFDMYPDGSAVRTATGDVVSGDTEDRGAPPPGEVEDREEVVASMARLWVHNVTQLKKADGHWLYGVQGVINNTPFSATVKLSDLRKIHDAVKYGPVGLGPARYHSYDLSGLFPGVHWRSCQAKGAEEWLQQLSVVMGDTDFPTPLREYIVSWFMQLDEVREDLMEETVGELRVKHHPITPAPWTPDGEALKCGICAARFGMLRRKHHCRRCGDVVCKGCSQRKQRLVEYHNSVKRVCERCWRGGGSPGVIPLDPAAPPIPTMRRCPPPVHHSAASVPSVPPVLWVQSAHQPLANGRYELVPQRTVNAMPLWKSTSGAYLYSGPRGRWIITDSEDDFPMGLGVMASAEPHQSSYPQEVVLWQTTMGRGAKASECCIDDYGARVRACPLVDGSVVSLDSDDEEWVDVDDRAWQSSSPSASVSPVSPHPTPDPPSPSNTLQAPATNSHTHQAEVQEKNLDKFVPDAPPQHSPEGTGPPPLPTSSSADMIGSLHTAASAGELQELLYPERHPLC